MCQITLAPAPLLYCSTTAPSYLLLCCQSLRQKHVYYFFVRNYNPGDRNEEKDVWGSNGEEPTEECVRETATAWADYLIFQESMILEDHVEIPLPLEPWCNKETLWQEAASRRYDMTWGLLGFILGTPWLTTTAMTGWEQTMKNSEDREDQEDLSGNFQRKYAPINSDSPQKEASYVPTDQSAHFISCVCSSLTPPTAHGDGAASVSSDLQEMMVSESRLLFSDAAKATIYGVSEWFGVTLEVGNEGAEKDQISNLLPPENLCSYWSHKVPQERCCFTFSFPCFHFSASSNHLCHDTTHQNLSLLSSSLTHEVPHNH